MDTYAVEQKEPNAYGDPDHTVLGTVLSALANSHIADDTIPSCPVRAREFVHRIAIESKR